MYSDGNISARSREPVVRRIKEELSEKEFREQRSKIENAAQIIEEVKDLLSNVLFLQNGKLSTGDIKYAAFRVQTLSLIFEVARYTFIRTAKTGEAAYKEFLKDLGDQVGFTFARALIARLRTHDQLLAVRTNRRLLELWALFENDTGAGVTEVSRCTNEEIVIRLRNNPLRSAESTPHVHCPFYEAYLWTLANELVAARAYYLHEQMENAHFDRYRVLSVEEKPDPDDNCVFHLKLKAVEQLGPAYDLLAGVFDALEKEAYGDALNLARGALRTAQLLKLQVVEGSAPEQLYKVFKDVLNPQDFKLMDDAYQRVSRLLHPETSAQEQANPIRVEGVIKDIRRSVDSIDLAPLSLDQANELVNKARRAEMVKKLQEAVIAAESLGPEEKKSIKNDLASLQEGRLDEKQQIRLVEKLKAVRGPLWEVAQPVLSAVLTSLIKQQTGLP